MRPEPRSDDDTAPLTAPAAARRLPSYLVRATAPTPPTSLGGYTILEEIGRGGTSVVYRAQDPRTKAQVAIKVLEAKNRSSAVERFEIEAWAIARIRHPGVAPIFDAVIDDDQAYIVMDFLSGGSLADRLAREGPQNPLQAADWIAQAAEAIAAAHERGIIHRDLKPANLLIADDGRLVVTDFGLAKARGLSSFLEPSLEDGLIGTPGFMAPEQILGRDPDARADVYGLGASLYALLSGAAPFRGGSLPGLLQKVLEQPPEPLRVPGLPRPLERLALRCLAKNPEQRPASAREVARACRAIKPGPKSGTRVLCLVLAALIGLALAFILGRWSAGIG